MATNLATNDAFGKKNGSFGSDTCSYTDTAAISDTLKTLQLLPERRISLRDLH
ncbi:MAG: hypothetical protein HFJ63_04290 [Atopobiaceae bacterium]|nr:hypothetical protein [Atopobiaceae bacterium]